MKLHLAPTSSPVRSPLGRDLARKALGQVANDNGAISLGNDMLLRAALRHFAEHGLGAARAARVQAESAFFAGDRQSYDWWLGVCRTLDRRMADQLHQATTEETGQDVPDGPN